MRVSRFSVQGGVDFPSNRERARNWSSFGLALHLLCIGAETPIPIQTITKQLQIQFCALSLLGWILTVVSRKINLAIRYGSCEPNSILFVANVVHKSVYLLPCTCPNAKNIVNES